MSAVEDPQGGDISCRHSHEPLLYNPSCITPTQLLDAIPELRPIHTQALIARKGKKGELLKGEYQLTKEADDQTASANWDELFCIYSHLTEEDAAPPAGTS